MAAIDMHVHAFPNDLAKRAVQTLSAAGQTQPRGNGTVKGLIKSMDKADIDVSVLCAIATKPSQVEGILEWCRKIKCERIEPLASVHPADAESPRWMARIASAGLIGVKLHPMYQDFAADEPRLDPIWQEAVDQGLLVACHCGLDLAYPPTDDRAAPERFARVLDRYPGLRLVCTHMGGWRSWDQVDRCIIGRNVILETSFSLDELGSSRAADMIRRHGIDKVCFGSDWPWKDQGEAIALLKGVGLSEKETDAVLYRTAAGILGH
jgi:uncharacterized protein